MKILITLALLLAGCGGSAPVSPPTVLPPPVVCVVTPPMGEVCR
jgi:hypothetical protein